MNSSIKRKLASSSGASIIVALFYLALCAIFGAVVLSAASGSIKRAADQASAGRDYQPLSSAVRLVADGMGAINYCNCSYGTVDISDPEGDCPDTDGHTAQSLDSNYLSDSLLGFSGGRAAINGALQTKIKTLADQVWAGIDSPSCTVSIEASQTPGALTVGTDQTIELVISMDSDYNLTMVFTGSSDYESIVLRYAAYAVDDSVVLSSSHNYTKEKTVTVYEADGTTPKQKDDGTGNMVDVTETVTETFECVCSCEKDSVSVHWTAIPELSERVVK